MYHQEDTLFSVGYIIHYCKNLDNMEILTVACGIGLMYVSAGGYIIFCRIQLIYIIVKI